MPKTNPKTKNCELCRKPFRSAKRHTVQASYYDPSKKSKQTVLIVCGMCKSNLHNWQYKFANSKLPPKKSVTIFGKDFEIDGWFGFNISCGGNKKQFKGKDKKNKQSARSVKRYSRKFGFGSAMARRRWMNEHEEAIRKTNDPEYRREVEKIWTSSELKQFNRMMEAEREAKRNEEARLMQQLEEEFSEPFRNWLAK